MFKQSSKPKICCKSCKKTFAAATLALMLCLTSVCLLGKVQAQDLIVNASFANQPTLAANEKIELQLSRPLQTSEGKLAVLIGQTDLSAFFIATENRLSYTPTLILLPAGENQLTVYLVSPTNEWKLIAQFAITVSDEKKADTTALQQNDSAAQPSQPSKTEKRKTILDKIGFAPALTLGFKSQPAESHFPDSSAPARPTFSDFTLQGTLRSAMKNDQMGYQSQFDVAGSSFQQEALRFSQLAGNAPRIDLASYLMQFNVGKTLVQAGHLAFGTNRHLINSFSSRGISLTVPVTSRGDFSIAAMNGTSIVGYDNFFGLTRRKHQMLTGTFGFEFIPERQGGLRFETGVLHGSLLPASNFNQGSITDAEQSKGLSFRVVASDKAQRFKLDSGFAKSLFNNANDPLLNQGNEIVPVRAVTRNGQYLDATVNLLQNLKLTPNKQANLAFNLRHERVDPLFRSLAAFTQADRLQNQYELVGAIGEMNATFSHQRLSDNLANIPSILKTLTRRNALILAAPLTMFLGKADQPSAWLPRLAYSFDRTHQFGANNPTNGGFIEASQIPDQFSTNQTFASDWQVRAYRFAYRFNRSFQDNRQEGRELADLKNIVNSFAIGLPALGKFDLAFDVSAERANNRESNRTDRALRITASLNWRMSESATFAANLSGAGAGDAAKTARNRNAEFDLQWAYRFNLGKEGFKKMQGQFFIRYANRYANSRDNLFNLNNQTKAQTLNTGLSFTFF